MKYKYKSLKDFKIDNPKEYAYCVKHKFIHNLCKDMGWNDYKERKYRGYWTKELCLSEALKYNTKGEWSKNSSSSYKISQKEGWFDECTNHMIELIKPKGYWCKESCLPIALKYDTKIAWKTYDQASYEAARVNDWFEECVAHMVVYNKPGSYWTKELFLAEALKHTTLKSLIKVCGAGVKFAKKNGWYKEGVAHINIRKINFPNVTKPQGYWNEDTFREECKKFSSYKEFRKVNPSAVECARTKGYLDIVLNEFGWVRGTRPDGRPIKWSKEKILANALLFDTKVAWEKAKGSSYGVAKNYGLYDECTAHMTVLCKPKGYWTLELCMVEALKFNLKEDWKKGHHLSYSGARSGGHMIACTAHMIKGHKGAGYWSKERCMEEALKYTTPKEWRVGNQTSYNAAKKNKWLDDCSKHMIKSKHMNHPKGYWTLELCMAEALKCVSKTDWRQKRGGSALMAIKNGWYEECTKHFKNYATRRKIKI